MKTPAFCFLVVAALLTAFASPVEARWFRKNPNKAYADAIFGALSKQTRAFESSVRTQSSNDARLDAWAVSMKQLVTDLRAVEDSHDVDSELVGIKAKMTREAEKLYALLLLSDRMQRSHEIVAQADRLEVVQREFDRYVARKKL